jgi:hypothetical protein
MNLYDRVGPWGFSGADILLATIAVLAVLWIIHLRFFRKW